MEKGCRLTPLTQGRNLLRLGGCQMCRHNFLGTFHGKIKILNMHIDQFHRCFVLDEI